MRAEPILLLVNGESHHPAVAPDVTLLHVLRNDLALNSPKYGCGLGECGACTVLVDGLAARACVLPVGQMRGRCIVTLEGLADGERLHPVQQAFVDAQAAQCGYCLAGMIMTAKAFLDHTPEPTGAQIREALKYNLCRCGTHVEILHAVDLAVQYIARAA